MGEIYKRIDLSIPIPHMDADELFPRYMAHELIKRIIGQDTTMVNVQ